MRILPVLALLLLGCGAAAGRPARAEPDDTGAYDLLAERHVTPGASWDEHVVHEEAEATATAVLDRVETEESRERVELVGRVSVTGETTSEVRVVVLTVDDFSGAGPRALVPPGTILRVTHGSAGTVVGPAGPFSEVDEAFIRSVVHVGSSASGHDEGSAARALGPPGGRARVGETWTLDPTGVAALFQGSSNEIRVGSRGVEGAGRLETGETWEGYECLAIAIDLAVHDFEMPLPPGASIDDVELRLTGRTSWPLDLTVPGGGDTIASETSVVLTMTVPEAPGVVARVQVAQRDVTTRTRSGFRLP